MRNEKPELFNITLEEQIVKMAAEVSVNLLRLLMRARASRRSRAKNGRARRKAKEERTRQEVRARYE
jgi:hypothetical protein